MRRELDLLLVAEAARVVGDVTPGIIRVAAKEGRLPVAHRTPSGVRLFWRADVERFAEERKRRKAA